MESKMNKQKPYRGLTKDRKLTKGNEWKYEWVYGWYAKVDGKHYIIPNEAERLGAGWEDDTNAEVIYGYTEVIPETVGQQLPFDAQNGNKIYEGDVAKHSCGKLFIIESTEIGWNPFDEHCVKPHRIECIVGNVHQNPKLLERT